MPLLHIPFITLRPAALLGKRQRVFFNDAKLNAILANSINPAIFSDF
jgi:hypothetical protein